MGQTAPWRLVCTAPAPHQQTPLACLRNKHTHKSKNIPLRFDGKPYPADEINFLLWVMKGFLGVTTYRGAARLRPPSSSEWIPRWGLWRRTAWDGGTSEAMVKHAVTLNQRRQRVSKHIDHDRMEYRIGFTFSFSGYISRKGLTSTNVSLL